jgi:hypothetical protein
MDFAALDGYGQPAAAPVYLSVQCPGRIAVPHRRWTDMDTGTRENRPFVTTVYIDNRRSDAPA